MQAREGFDGGSSMFYFSYVLFVIAVHVAGVISLDIDLWKP